MKLKNSFFLGAAFSLWWIITSVFIVMLPTSVRVIHSLANPQLLSRTSLAAQSQLVAVSVLPFTTVLSLTQNPYFTQAEKSHLLDVKSVSTSIFLLWVSVTVFIFLMIKKHHVERMSILAQSTKALTIILIGISMLTTLWWETLFVLFHQVFFPQGNWSFPEESMLITLYPEQFWQTAAVVVGILSIVLALLSNFLVRMLTLSKSRVRLNESSLNA